MVQNKGSADPFDPDGSAEEFTVAGRKLTMRPLSVKNTKRLIEIIETATEGLDRSKPESFTLSNMTEKFTGKAKDALLLIFPRSNYEFLTDEFIDDNFTLPMFKVMADRVIRMNDLAGWFPHLLLDGRTPSPVGPGSTTS